MGKQHPISFLKVLNWTEQECRNYLAEHRWPSGPVCPKCGAGDAYTFTRNAASKNAIRTLYKCRAKACKKQFTVTVGTIFEDSHIPLNKWFAAIYLMNASKKGISAHQIHRQLDITYSAAWFMCHRVRHAMLDKSPLPLKGIVEADETYIYPKRRRGHPTWHENIKDEQEMGLRPTPKNLGPYAGKPMVFGILERGGSVRTMVASEASAKALQPLIRGFVDVPNTRLITDGNRAYKGIKKEMPHDVINHEETYVVGDVHTQNIDGYWSLLKRGLYGTFHHVDAQYLPNYLNEFEFRFNRRKMDDEPRFAALMGQMQGRVTWFCEKPQQENRYA